MFRCVLLLSFIIRTHAATTTTLSSTTTGSTTTVPAVINYTVSSGSVATVHTGVVAQYDKNIMPANTDSTLDIWVDFQLNGIMGFNELAGQIDVAGVVNVSWQMATLTWNPAQYSGVGLITLDQQDIWTPPITLYNSMTSLGQIGHKYFKVNIIFNGKTVWAPPVILHVGCAVDVLYFPFDSQNCSIELMSWQYEKTEINIIAVSDTAGITSYEENMLWDLQSTEIAVSERNNKALYAVHLALKRRPLYFIIVLILPVLLLGALTPFTFYIPIEEGRVGYAMTVFLTFSVFLILIADNIPKSSDPMALLSWYVVSQVGVGGLVTVMSLVVVRWHTKEDDIDVPQCMLSFSAFISCTVCERPNKDNDADKKPKGPTPEEWIQKHGNEIDVGIVDTLPSDFKFGAPNQKWRTFREKVVEDMDFSELCYVPKISWIQVARIMDHFFFLLFFIFQLILAGVLLLPVTTH